MNEDGKKKREWVKTAAIVFLAVMLVLTFFSNTIMNYSLPEVATQYVQSGTITAKIRGSGVVESGDPYNVEIKESRKVASVAVRVGDTVEKGDILMYLEDAESDELKQAKEALEAAWDAYNTAVLGADVTAADIQAAQTGVSTETYRQQITAAQNAVKAAENEVTAAQNEVDAAQRTVEEIQKRYDAFDIQISITPENTADVSKEQAAYDAAKLALDIAKSNLDSAERELTYAKEAEENLPENASEEEKTAAGNRITAAEKERNEKSEAMSKCETEVLIAEKALNDKRNSGDTSAVISNLKYQQSLVGKELTDAKSVLADKQTILEQKQSLVSEKQEALAELSSKISRVTGLESYLDAIARAQEQVDELTAKSIGATIEAPISGTITALNVTAGETASAAVPVAVMQPEGKGYTLSFSVTNEQAQRLSVGDQADLVNAWRYDNVTVTLASIKPDTTDPGQRKLLTFDVTGNVTAGQTLNLSVGQKSSNYDLIVPNSAIREDNNGKFVLIVESKPGPLNTRYIATRVDVEVLASDDTQSAISGALSGYEFVITTSTKPVEAGKQVRLAD